MSDSIVYFEAKTTFDDDSIRLLFQAEYYSYERLKILLRSGLGALILVVALFFVESMSIKGVLLMVGCWFLVSTDFPSRIRSEQVIQSRGGQKSSVIYRFTQNAVIIDQTGRSLSYDKVDRMLVGKGYFYLFESRQNAVMIPRGIWSKEKQQKFVSFLADKTGKEWKQSKGLLSLNLHDLLDMLRDRSN